ncbi:hypothetical protein ACE3L8_12120 [Staphylococcus simulans]|uniref:hypothetical protein n=1 Tax=Staphylococcus simulans TaxID=1286 RepID=UPI00365914C0
MLALIIVLVLVVLIVYINSKEKTKISKAYDEQIIKGSEQLQSDFDINEINNIAQTRDNKDELIFNSGLTAVINNEDFYFVSNENEERIEFERPAGADMMRMFENENKKPVCIYPKNEKDDYSAMLQIRRYVISKGLKLYITKERYVELKKINVTFAKGE